MIEFTIKTLDSNNHQFTVDDDTTVEELKQKIRDQMGIEPNLQRLIFCGRVLQDEKKLSEYDVQGKVVHLVQRAPPSPGSRISLPSTTNTQPVAEGSTTTSQRIRRLMALASPTSEEVQRMQLSPTSGRLEFMRNIINDIKTDLAALREHENGELANPGASTSRPQPEAQTEPMETENTATADEPDAEEEDVPTIVTFTRVGGARRRAIRVRNRHVQPRNLAQLLEELEGLNEQFAPFRGTYIQLLRDANREHPPELSEEDRDNAQRSVDLVSDIMHSFAHAYHAASDLNFTVGQRIPRLASEATAHRHPIPMQAQINVFQSNRRPQNTANPVPSQNGAQPTNAQPNQSATPTPGQTGPENAAGAQGLNAPRNSTQPTVNISIQPNPITYQVEIETRVPIAFALDNGLLNGMTHNHGQAQGNQPATAAHNRPPAQNLNQAFQDSVANRNRQMLTELENQLFRGLNQAGAGGVEVVMRMEEIPHSGNATSTATSGATATAGGTPAGGNTGTANNVPPGTTSTATSGSYVTTGTTAPSGINGVNMPGPTTAGVSNGPAVHIESGVVVAPLPWGASPNADLLQNIVSSVIRQGLIPGLESMQNAHNIMTSQGNSQNPGGESGPAGHHAPTGGQNVPTGPPGQATGPTQGPQTQEQHARANRRPNIRLRGATTTSRAQTVSLSNLTYDPFLSCDSQYARARIQRRREQLQQSLAQQERMRSEREAALNIETLRGRADGITPDHMDTLLRLLYSNTPSAESWMNALMVTIARELFLTELMHAVAGDPAPVPNDFHPLRMTMRSYIQSMLERSGSDDGDNAFEGAADFLVQQHAEFISWMPNITPIREEVDVLRSIRALIRARLPAVISAVMSDQGGDSFASRFYPIFTRLFTDLCTLIAYCCVDGIEGLRTIYRAYMEEAVRHFEPPVQQLIMTLSMGNLNVIINNLSDMTDSIRQFIVNHEGVSIVVEEMLARRRAIHNQEVAAAANQGSPRNSSPPATPPPAPPSLAPTFSAEPNKPCNSMPTASASNQAVNANPATSPPTPATAPTSNQFNPANILASLCNFNRSPPTSRLNRPDDPSASPMFNRLNESLQAERDLLARFREPLSSRFGRLDERESLSPRFNRPESRDPLAAPFITPEERESHPPMFSFQRNHDPAMSLIMANFESNLFPVFERDYNTQRSAPPPAPYSDAYLTGMPSRKRRCVRQMRPDLTLEAFMSESVRDVQSPSQASAPPPASSNSAPIENEAMRAAFRERIRHMTRARASSDEDYDSGRYAAVVRFLDPRNTTRKPDDNNGGT